jgi:hypothetical protein
MSNKGRLLYKTSLFCFILLICSGKILGQDKLILSAGAGFAELYNVGLKYPYRKILIGVNAGILPAKDGSLISVSGEAYYHFKSIYRSLDKGPWYLRSGLGYLKDKSEASPNSFILIRARAGRDFNISQRIGISADMGLDFLLVKPKTESLGALPGFGIGLLYRL